MRARLHIWDEPLLDGGGGGKEGLIDTIGKHMRGHLASHSQRFLSDCWDYPSYSTLQHAHPRLTLGMFSNSAELSGLVTRFPAILPPPVVL